MQTSSLHYTQQKDYYGLKLLGAMILMILGLSYASFYLFQNYMTKNSFFQTTTPKSTLYFLSSETVEDVYQKNGMDYEGYKKRLHSLELLAKNNGYTTKSISTKQLQLLPKNVTLIALDMIALSPKEIDSINFFISNGGKIIFNFTSGFLNQDLQFQDKNLVTTLTPLTLNKDPNTIEYTKKSTGYFTLQLLSPLAPKNNHSQALELPIYDPLPLFKTPKTLQADAYLTNWSQTNFIQLSNKELDHSQSGLLWHGKKEKGKWIYFNFPSYIFFDANQTSYQKLFLAMLAYLDRDITIIPYPYIDTKSVVFVSEDTEYKYENLLQFSQTAKKNHFPVTAFCVANLATKHSLLMHKVGKNPYLEIGSHSYTHKQIVGLEEDVYEKETIGSKKELEKLTGKTVLGFRPPREEIDATMLAYLKKGGYKYILNKGENKLQSYFLEDILIIPRHGTDDYSYLIHLDWDSNAILKEIQHQTEVLHLLNGIYTLSTHTHLLSFGSNIAIEDAYYQYINTNKKYTPLNGNMIYTRLNSLKNFSYSYELTPKKIILTLHNNNATPIQNLHLSIDIGGNIILKNVESEIVGFQTTLIQETPATAVLQIAQLQPESEVTLFINYENY